LTDIEAGREVCQEQRSQQTHVASAGALAVASLPRHAPAPPCTASAVRSHAGYCGRAALPAAQEENALPPHTGRLGTVVRCSSSVATQAASVHQTTHVAHADVPLASRQAFFRLSVRYRAHRDAAHKCVFALSRSEWNRATGRTHAGTAIQRRKSVEWCQHAVPRPVLQPRQTPAAPPARERSANAS